jgi:hypothetical protein
MQVRASIVHRKHIALPSWISVTDTPETARREAAAREAAKREAAEASGYTRDCRKASG